LENLVSGAAKFLCAKKTRTGFRHAGYFGPAEPKWFWRHAIAGLVHARPSVLLRATARTTDMTPAERTFLKNRVGVVDDARLCDHLVGSFFSWWRAREIGQISMVMFLPQKSQLVSAALILAVAGLVMPAKGQTPPLNSDAPLLDIQGDPLPSGAIARLGTFRLRHQGPIGSVLFSPDGNYVIVSSKGIQELKIWNVRTAQLKQTLKCQFSEADMTELGKMMLQFPQAVPPVIGRTKDGKRIFGLPPDGVSPFEIDFLALSPDGRVIALLGERSAIWLWDLSTGKPLGGLQGPGSLGQGHVTSIAFSPDGRTLAGTGRGTRIYVWDVVSRKLQLEVGSEGFDWRVVFSSNGNSLLCGGQGSLSQWDLAAKKQLWSIKNSAVAGTRSFTFSVDAIKIAWLDSDGSIRVLDRNSTEQRTIAPPPEHPFKLVTISSNGRLLAACSEGPIIQIWDLTTGLQLHECLGHYGSVTDIVFSPDGTTMASGGADQTIRIWDVASGKERFPFTGHRRPISSLAFSPDSQNIASIGLLEEMRRWNVASRCETRPPVKIEGAGLVAFAPGGRTIAVAANQRVNLYEPGSSNNLVALEGHTLRVLAMQFAPDNKTIATAGYDDTIRHWRLKDGKELSCWSGGRVGSQIPSPAFSSDARILAIRDASEGRAGAEHEFLRLYEAGAEKKIPISFGPFSVRGISAMAFSPDNELLATGGGGSQQSGPTRISIWKSNTGAFLNGLNEIRTDAEWVRTPHVTQLAFSPDCRLLASAEDNIVELWELSTGQRVRSWAGHTREVACLAFANDGRTLASGSEDCTILLWDCTCGSRPTGLVNRKATPEQLAGWWKSLAEPAYESEPARWKLVEAGAQAVIYLKENLHVVPITGPDRLKALFSDLDADSFRKRELAQSELELLEEFAKPLLLEFLARRHSPEAGRRAREILKNFKTPPTSFYRELRAVDVLATIGSPEAIKLLHELAGGQPGARLTIVAEKACRRLENKRGFGGPRSEH
jgi:WD40 repeat protein